MKSWRYNQKAHASFTIIITLLHKCFLLSSKIKLQYSRELTFCKCMQSSLGADSKMRLNEWGRESHYSGQALFTSYFSFRNISQFEKSAKCWIFKYIGI